MLRNISPSNIFPNRLLGKRFDQHHQAVLAAVSINGLNSPFGRIWRGVCLRSCFDPLPAGYCEGCRADRLRRR